MRRKLLRIYNSALQSVKGDVCVIDYLKTNEFSSRLTPNESVAVLAIGKASVDMAHGAYSVLEKSIIAGLVVTKEDHIVASKCVKSFIYIESSHPVPSHKSITAAETVIDFISALPASTHLLVLISGGASALVEKPIPGVSLETLVKVNKWLLSSGLSIEEINTIRSSLSVIKGGGMLSFVAQRKVTNLLLSDVNSNEPSFIGSGLFIKNSKEIKIKSSLPSWLSIMLDNYKPKERFDTGQVYTQIIASNQRLLNTLRKISAMETNNIYFSKDSLTHAVEMEADKIISTLNENGCGIYIWGGEPTVNYSHCETDIGRGGRNQHLALLIASKLQNMDNIAVLCIGTDGTDGNTDDAGALVNAETIIRGENEGYSVDECLNGFNSSAFLHASGDIVTTGPTGTNVMDVVIAYKW